MWSGSRNICTQASVVASHTLTVLSNPLLARSRPSELGATISTVASSHVSMISHPHVVSELILTAAQAAVTA